METVKKLFWTSRPVSWINTAYPFAVTYLLAGGKNWLSFAIGTLFFLIPYNLVMYGVNDVYDYESDKRNPRKGSIEGALLDPKWHPVILQMSIWVSAPFLIYLWLSGNLISTFWLAIIMFAVVAYSAMRFRMKERPYYDSFTSATHFVGPMIFGLHYAGVREYDPQVILIIIAFYMWGFASHAFGAVQDIVADRQAGIKSIATALGARMTVRLAFFMYAGAGVVMLTATQLQAQLSGLATIGYLVIVGRFWNITDETAESANAGWRKFIWLNYLAGFIITLLVIWYAITR